ncbi:MAG: thiamine phosphate synthase [Planctomycetota bacterium]
MTENHRQTRLIDALLNRAREGARVVEDHLRFVMDRPALSKRAKTIRHELTCVATSCIDTTELVRRRDVPSDVGRHTKTDTEAQRPDTAHLLGANFKRLQEALRSLEEHAKLAGWSEAARAFEDLRYRSYELESDVATSGHRRRLLAGRDLYVLVTAALCSRDVLETVREIVEAGVELIQIREKDMPDRALLEHTRRVLDIAAPAGVPVLVNDNTAVARLAGAAGVHVGQNDLACRDIRTICGGDAVVGISAGSVDEARVAEADGADCLGTGPVFYTDTKKVERGLGTGHLVEVIRSVSIPVHAIGGITPENIDEVLEAGCASVAVCSAVISATDPGRVTARLKEKIDRARARQSDHGGPR